MPLLALALLAAGAGKTSTGFDPQLYAGMHWRLIGPHRGGRAVTATGVPGQPEVFYFGAVGGGVWKTENAGRTWEPIFDGGTTGSIGAIAVAPSDPNVLYVGTGEADIRSDLSIGDGVYKSADAGRTWKAVGLRDTRQIARILVDPRDPNLVFVAALGHAYGPNEERGVYRSADGGLTWKKVLYKDATTGAIDLAMDPADSRALYATLWNAHRVAWSTYAPIGGPGGGLYRSTDGGLTWSEVRGEGLPAGDWGRAGIAVERMRGAVRLYLILDLTEKGGLYRSDDDGRTWQLASSNARIHGRGWYFGTVTADPQNPEVVYVPNVSLYRSTDGGQTFSPFKGQPGGDDYHFLWINPEDPRRMIVVSDQGAVITVDGGRTWSSWYNQPTGQFYRVSTDNAFPYRVYGPQQDSGTAGVASRSDYGSITYRDWYSVGGGEAGMILADPRDPSVVISGDTYGRLYRFDRRTGQSQDISPDPVEVFAEDISARPLRFTWTSPLAFSPQNLRTLYFGAQNVLETENEGMSWRTISPDLTGADPKASREGPVTPENAIARGFGVVYALAPSPVRAGEIWAGSDTGLLHLTLDGGTTWADVTPASLGAWSRISALEASHFDAGAAYAAVDRHRLDDYNPYVYRTRDYGKTWTKCFEGIAPLAYVHVVREDPVRKGLLYAGTERGVYVSFDDGDLWQPLQLNLPVAPIYDLTVHGDDLVAATHGRAFWILDDLAPLRQLTPQVARSRTFLFAPAEAFRLRRTELHDTPLPPETPAGENPPAGAVLDYWLGTTVQSEVSLEILDEGGQLIRRYSSSDPVRKPDASAPFPSGWLRPAPPLSREPGMHRVVWDLRCPSPVPNSHSYDIGGVWGQDLPSQPEGPLVLPGRYLVRLSVEGRTQTQPLVVELDPRVTASRPELAKAFALAMQIDSAIGRAEQARHELEALRAALKNLAAQGSDQDVLAATAALDRKAAVFDSVGTSYTGLKKAEMMLAGLLRIVDGADRAPTAQANARFNEENHSLEAQLRAWKNILEQDLPTLNTLLAGRGLPPIQIR